MTLLAIAFLCGASFMRWAHEHRDRVCRERSPARYITLGPVDFASAEDAARMVGGSE